MILRVANSNVAGVNGDYELGDLLNEHRWYKKLNTPFFVLNDGMNWRIGPSLDTNDEAYHYSYDAGQGDAAAVGEYLPNEPGNGTAIVSFVEEAPSEIFSGWSDDASILLTQEITFETGKVQNLVLSQISNHVYASWNAYGGADGYEIAWKLAADQAFGQAVRVTQTNWSAVIDGVTFDYLLYTFRVRAFHAV